MPAPYVTTYTARDPYLTNAEYLAAPTGVDVNQLLPGQSTQSNAAALTQTIARASNWADVICAQVLACTQETETGELRADRFSRWLIHPKQWPVVDVLNVTVTPISGGLAIVLNLTGVWLEESRIVIPTTGTLGMSSVGPLQLGAAGRGQSAYGQWTYLAGWPNTTITAGVSAAAVTIPVASVLGIYGTQSAQFVTTGTVLTIYDGGLTEQVQVTAVAGNTLTISSGLANAHAAGVSITAFPPAIKQAVTSLTSALIKTRGSEALVMQSLRSGPSKTDGMGEAGGIEDVEIAIDLLDIFRRVR